MMSEGTDTVAASPAGQAAVVPGQYFTQMNAHRTLWRVQAVFRPGAGVLHARLVRVDQPSILKTVSCSALSDPLLFSPVNRTPQRGTAAAPPVSRQGSGPGDVFVPGSAGRRSAVLSVPHSPRNAVVRWVLDRLGRQREDGEAI